MTTIEKATLVSKLCPNYDNIVGFDYGADDLISKQIIDDYRDYVFSADSNCKEQLLIIRQLDTAVCEYINNNKFYRKVQDYYNNLEIVNDGPEYINYLVKSFIKLHNDYCDGLLKEIPNTKWL